MLAEAEEPEPASGATPSCLSPEVKVTLPVGVAPLAPVTVAVMVSEPVEATEVAVDCRATDAAARAVAVPAGFQAVTRL